MPRARIDFDTVRRLAREFGEVEETSTYGSPALKVQGKLLACIAINKSAEAGSLAVRIDIERRDGLIADAPDVYYITDHYRNYPTVLVRMSRIHEDALKDLLRAAWAFVTAKPPAKKKPTRSRRS